MELDFNTAEKVMKVIETLYTMLEQVRRAEKMDDKDIVSALKPLYLPSTEGKLVCTSELVYCDSKIYKRCKLDHLAEAGLFLLHLSNTNSKFNERTFCEMLPKPIRPKGLSTCCNQTLREDCMIVSNSRFAESLKTTLELPQFSKAVLVVLKHCTKDETLCTEFEQFLQKFLQNIRIFTVNNLQTDITLTTVQPHQTLGTATVDFHLQEDEHSFNFYINSKMSGARNLHVFKFLAEYLISATKKNVSLSTLYKLKDFLAGLLSAQTAEDIQDALDDEKLSVDSAEFNANITPKLGKSIPESWHHRLDQDINNLFYPQEWVGYEDREDHFIFLQIIHPVVEDDDANSQDVGVRIRMRYKIYVSEDDEEGIEVSALDLYKFL